MGEKQILYSFECELLTCDLHLQISSKISDPVKLALSTCGVSRFTMLCVSETHEKAEVKARKACETSNLDTSDKEEMRKSRFLRRRDLSQELEFLEEPLRNNGTKSPPYPNFEEVNSRAHLEPITSPYQQSPSTYQPSQPFYEPSPTSSQPSPTSYQPSPTSNQPSPTSYQPSPTSFHLHTTKLSSIHILQSRNFKSATVNNVMRPHVTETDVMTSTPDARLFQ
ncbi:hypothetical protein LSTR_LSTR011943 [Laodelphax striatellus]|uniref:Uncharacterized protein n=1 Tax=Laodelphax striatellus TaxID=195883 RepID=A0A482WY84_LAOST|nr:hypothetical protein LSTR_LSTR011943 [Laodelphax striatellus]